MKKNLKIVRLRFGWSLLLLTLLLAAACKNQNAGQHQHGMQNTAIRQPPNTPAPCTPTWCATNRANARNAEWT